MIKKTTLGKQEGYLREGARGFFVARNKGAMPNGARFDKISISGTYKQGGVVLFATKKLGSRDVHRGKTYAICAIETDLLPELIQALTMLAMEIGGGQVAHPMPPVQHHNPEEAHTEEQKELDEVETWLHDHKGQFSY